MRATDDTGSRANASARRGDARASGVTALVAPLVSALGLEVDRVELRPAGRRTLVQIYLDGDGPDGLGPSLDEISDATRAISAALDDSPVVGDGPYTLEVSSRGVGRPLTQPKHFRRNRGRLVELTLPDGTVTGRITAVDADAGQAGAVVLDVDGAATTVALNSIDKAVVRVELNRPDEED